MPLRRKVCSMYAISDQVRRRHFFVILGLNCIGRLFVSDRAHLVFDFHQIVDGLKEVELGGSRYRPSQ